MNPPDVCADTEDEAATNGPSWGTGGDGHFWAVDDAGTVYYGLFYINYRPAIGRWGLQLFVYVEGLGIFYDGAFFITAADSPTTFSPVALAWSGSKVASPLTNDIGADYTLTSLSVEIIDNNCCKNGENCQQGTPDANGDCVEPLAAAPCMGCGDKTNIAELRSSPAAMEQMLA